MGGELGVVDLGAIEAEALVVAVQMRGGVEPGADARFLRNRRAHRGHGTFAVRTGNMDKLKTSLGVAQCGAKSPNRIEAELRVGLAPRKEISKLDRNLAHGMAAVRRARSARRMARRWTGVRSSRPAR